jgi:hypothetical protein
MVCLNDDDDKRWCSISSRRSSRRRNKYKGWLLSAAATLLLLLWGSVNVDDDSVTFTTGQSYSWIQWVQVPSDNNNRLDEPTTTTVAAATGSIDLGDLEFTVRIRDKPELSCCWMDDDYDNLTNDYDNQTKEIYVRVGASLRRIVPKQGRGSFASSSGLACCDKNHFANKRCPVLGDVYVSAPYADNVVVEDLGLLQVSLESNRPNAVARFPKPFTPISHTGYYQVEITICAVDSLPRGYPHDFNTQVTLNRLPEFENSRSPALQLYRKVCRVAALVYTLGAVVLGFVLVRHLSKRRIRENSTIPLILWMDLPLVMAWILLCLLAGEIWLRYQDLTWRAAHYHGYLVAIVATRSLRMGVLAVYLTQLLHLGWWWSAVDEMADTLLDEKSCGETTARRTYLWTKRRRVVVAIWATVGGTCTVLEYAWKWAPDHITAQKATLFLCSVLVAALCLSHHSLGGRLKSADEDGSSILRDRRHVRCLYRHLAICVVVYGVVFPLVYIQFVQSPLRLALRAHIPDVIDSISAHPGTISAYPGLPIVHRHWVDLLFMYANTAWMVAYTTYTWLHRASPLYRRLDTGASDGGGAAAPLLGVVELAYKV